MSGKRDTIEVEGRRIREEYARREAELDPDLYAPWQPVEMFMRAERKRQAALMLHAAGVFPGAESRCLEVGYGSLGWCGDLITWGVCEANIHGVELDESRAARARRLLPAADLRCGDATSLPWGDGHFDLAVVSTVFTSVLSDEVRRALAAEIVRVLADGAALLWYDFAVNNPRNPHVRGVARGELGRLFPGLEGRVRSVTLAPPLARLVVPRSWALATLLESIPLLRTHLLGVLLKNGRRPR